jgi:hypothetical protein
MAPEHPWGKLGTRGQTGRLLSHPPKRSRLRQADVRQHAVGKLARHGFQAFQLGVVGGNQGKNRCTGVGGQGHVANVDSIERCLPHAQHERPAFLQAHVRGAFDEFIGGTVGDPRQRPHAARNNHHGISRIGPAGHIGSDVVIVLLMDLLGLLNQELF